MFDDDVLDSISVSIFEFIKRHGEGFLDVQKFEKLSEKNKELFRALATDILSQVDDVDFDYADDDDWMETEWD